MSLKRNELEDLQQWYDHQCDGRWEHAYGIEIRTMDNPGWSIVIDLCETELHEITMDRVSNRIDSIDWMDYEIRGGKFVGYCGPVKLNDLLKVFSNLVDAHASK